MNQTHYLYLIIKLLCYFSFKMEETDRQTDKRLCRVYNLSHVPELIHPAVFRHPTSLEVSGSAETVSCTSPATRLCTKHNSTHTTEKKKTSTWYSQEYTNIYHSFLAHYKISYKSLQHIMYTLYPNTRRSHPGHRHSARHRLELPSSRSPPTPPVSRSAMTRLWVVVQQEGASSSCEGTSFCYLKEAYCQSLAGIRSQSKVPASGSNLALLWGNSAKHQQGELSYTTAPASTPCSTPRLWFGSPTPKRK